MSHAITALLFAACSSTTPPVASPPPPEPVVVLATAPSDALELRVSAYRWSCTIVDPQGIEDHGELRVPLGRAIRLVLTNIDVFEDIDVALTFADTPVRKHLAKDGGAAEIVFRIDQLGPYTWQCPTQVPPNASRQAATYAILVASPEEYAAYQVAQREATHPTTREGQVRLAKTLVEKKGCTSCHSDDGSPRVGASFAGIWGTAMQLADGNKRILDASYLEQVINNPKSLHRDGYPPSMPSYEGLFNADEIAAIAAYIESLAR